MAKDPRVTIIVTTRNNEATLDACLKSIQAQDYSDVELIVVDNNSTDSTAQIAATYTDKVYNQGPERSAQRNFGVEKSTGVYVGIIDSDMELPVSMVTEAVAVISDQAQAIIIPEVSFGEGFWTQTKVLERSFYNGVDWIEAPRFFSKVIYQQVGGYDEQMSGGEDWDLTARIRDVTNVVRTSTPIRHNEGRLTLKGIISKRLYYTKGFTAYYDKPKPKTEMRGKVGQVVGVYALFIKSPFRLLKNPVLGIGMVTMKTAEFMAIGFALLLDKFPKSSLDSILILGTHGQKNIGDDMLLQVFLENIGKKDTNFFVNSYDPNRTKKDNQNFNITSFHTTRDPLGLIKALLKSKTTIFAGGSIIKELNSAYGGSRYRTLYLLYCVTLVIRMFPSRKLIMSNIGVGPIDSKFGNFLSQQILNRAQMITVRDTDSLNIINKMSLKISASYVPDAALVLSKKIFDEEASPTNIIPAGKKRVIINLCRNIQFPEYWEKFYSEMISTVSILNRTMPNLQFIALPMQSRVESNNDYDLLTKFIFDVKIIEPKIDFEMDESTNYKEAGNLISSANLIIAERLHSVLLSIVVGVPFLALEYDIKVTNILMSLNLQNYGVKIDHNINNLDLSSKALDMIAYPDTYTAKIDKCYKINHHDQLMYFNKLRSLITENNS